MSRPQEALPLDPWIIEEIKRKEEERRRRSEDRPAVELPLDDPRDDPRYNPEPNPDNRRGVEIIELQEEQD